MPPKITVRSPSPTESTYSDRTDFTITPKKDKGKGRARAENPFADPPPLPVTSTVRQSAAPSSSKRAAAPRAGASTSRQAVVDPDTLSQEDLKIYNAIMKPWKGTSRPVTQQQMDDYKAKQNQVRAPKPAPQVSVALQQSTVPTASTPQGPTQEQVRAVANQLSSDLNISIYKMLEIDAKYDNMDSGNFLFTEEDQKKLIEEIKLQFLLEGQPLKHEKNDLSNLLTSARWYAQSQTVDTVSFYYSKLNKNNKRNNIELLIKNMPKLVASHLKNSKNSIDIKNSNFYNNIYPSKAYKYADVQIYALKLYSELYEKSLEDLESHNEAAKDTALDLNEWLHLGSLLCQQIPQLSDHKHDQERKDAIDKGEVIGATVGAIGATGAAIPAVAFTLGLSLLVGPTVGLGVGMKMGGQIANGTHRLLHKKQPSAQNFALDIVSKLLSDLEKRDGGFSKSTFIDDKIAIQFIQNFNDMQKIMSEKKPKGAKVKEVTDLKHSEGVQDAAIFHTKRTNRKTLGRGNPLESLTPEKMTAEFERMKAEDAANKGF